MAVEGKMDTAQDAELGAVMTVLLGVLADLPLLLDAGQRVQEVEPYVALEAQPHLLEAGPQEAQPLEAGLRFLEVETQDYLPCLIDMVRIWHHQGLVFSLRREVTILALQLFHSPFQLLLSL